MDDNNSEVGQIEAKSEGEIKIPVQADIPVMQQPAMPPVEPKKSKLKFALLLVPILLIAGVLVFTQLKSTDDAAVNESEVVEANAAQGSQAGDNGEASTAPIEGVKKLKSIMYYHSDDFDSAGAIYSRLIAEGEKTEIESFTSAENRPQNYFSGNLMQPNISNIVTYTVFDESGASIYTSMNSGKGKKVYTGDKGVEVQSPVVSTDGKKIIFGRYNSQAGSPTQTMIMNVDGSNLKVLADENSFNVGAWSSDGDVVSTYYLGGGRGGPFPNPTFFSLTGEPVGSPLGDLDYNRRQAYDFSNDLSEAVYVQARLTGVDNCHGPCTAAPYEVMVRDITGDTVQKVASIGEEDKNDTLGNSTYRNVVVGYIQTVSGEVPFYTDGNKVMRVGSSGNSVMFESGQGDISQVYYASEDEILVGISNKANDGTIVTHYDLESNEATRIMETTTSTQILGVNFE